MTDQQKDIISAKEAINLIDLPWKTEALYRHLSSLKNDPEFEGLPRELSALFRYSRASAQLEVTAENKDYWYEILREGLYHWQMIYMKNIWDVIGVRPHRTTICEIGCGWGGMIELYKRANPEAHCSALDKHISETTKARFASLNIHFLVLDADMGDDFLSKIRHWTFDVLILSEFIHTKDPEFISRMLDNFRTLGVNGVYIIERTEESGKYLDYRLKHRFGKKDGLWPEAKIKDFMMELGFRLHHNAVVGIHYIQAWSTK